MISDGICHTEDNNNQEDMKEKRKNNLKVDLGSAEDDQLMNLNISGKFQYCCDVKLL